MDISAERFIISNVVGIYRHRRADGFEVQYPHDTGDLVQMLSSVEASMLRKNLILITGGYCVGKTSVVRGLAAKGFVKQIPEVMVRRPRSGEIVGEEMISYSYTQYRNAIRDGKMAFAYLDRGTQKSRFKHCGILLETLRFAANYDGKTAIILHPLAVSWLADAFQCLTIGIITDPISRIQYQEERGLARCDLDGVNCIGSQTESIVLPGANVNNIITNRFGHLEETIELIWEQVQLNDEMTRLKHHRQHKQSIILRQAA